MQNMYKGYIKKNSFLLMRITKYFKYFIQLFCLLKNQMYFFCSFIFRL